MESEAGEGVSSRGRSVLETTLVLRARHRRTAEARVGGVVDTLPERLSARPQLVRARWDDGASQPLLQVIVAVGCAEGGAELLAVEGRPANSVVFNIPTTVRGPSVGGRRTRERLE